MPLLLTGNSPLLRGLLLPLTARRDHSGLARHAPAASVLLLGASTPFSPLTMKPQSPATLLLLFPSSAKFSTTNRTPMRISRPRAARDEDREDEPPSSSDGTVTNKTRSRLAVLASAGTAVAVLGAKSKALLGILKLTKMSSLLSMLATTGAYSLFFGLPFAAGMVTHTLIHESGHALAMHRYGIPFRPMMFIPFVGAFVAMERNPLDAYEEAVVALAGPLAGLGAAVATTSVGMQTDSQLMFALADFGYMINLFNLLPIGTLDGGRATSALSPYFQLVGLGTGAGLVYVGLVHNPIFYLILFAGAYGAYERFTDNSLRALRYYNIPRGKKIFIGTSYVAIVAALLLGMAFNNRYKKSIQTLKRGRRDNVFDEWSVDV